MLGSVINKHTLVDVLAQLGPSSALGSLSKALTGLKHQ